ncbi:MAG: hypothetical protein ACI97N_001885 [Cognaticolwellia sp.]|jgi:hypothetical protein
MISDVPNAKAIGTFFFEKNYMVLKTLQVFYTFSLPLYPVM